MAALYDRHHIVNIQTGAATVVAVKVCNNLPLSDPDAGCPDYAIINGVDYVMSKAQSSDIINMSLGVYDPNDNHINVDNAVVNAANTGLRFVISAGNDKVDTSYDSPARTAVNNSNIWAVSAFKQGDIFAVNFDYGSNCYAGSNFGNPLIQYSESDDNVPSLRIGGGWGMGFPGTGTEDGTSYAAPHLAGLLLVGPNNLATDGTVSNDPDNDPDPIGVIPPPPPPLSVYITGPQDVQPNTYPTWTAQPSNGATPYQYDWQERQKPYGGGSWSPWYNFGDHQSEGMTYNYSIYKVELKVTVTDATNETATNTYFAYFNHNSQNNILLDSTQTDSAGQQQ